MTPPRLDEGSEREAFEAWAKKRGNRLDKFGSALGVWAYEDDETQAAFVAWQASAALSTGRLGGEWLPIESAPKDGTRVLAWSETYGARETYWRLYGDGSIAKQQFLAGKGPSGAWDWSEPQHHWAASWNPSHYMPLPPAPAAKPQGDSNDQ